MNVRQISIFLENRAGRLEEITRILEEAQINIRALSLADTSDFGILRLIVSNPDGALTALRQEGFTVRENEVLAVEVEDRPGGLHRILKILADAGVSIEYMYAFLERKTDKAVIIIRVEVVAKAIKTLQDMGLSLLKSEEVYKL